MFLGILLVLGTAPAWAQATSTSTITGQVTDQGAANLWSNNHKIINGKATPLPSNHRNRFGGTLGGQLIPKKILGGKAYFFVNFEG